MKYALKLSNDNRVLFWLRVYPDGNYDGMTMVDTVPDGYINDYLYINGEYVYDPLPKPEQPEPIEEPTVWDELDAAYQAGYNEGYQEGVNSAYEQ